MGESDGREKVGSPKIRERRSEYSTADNDDDGYILLLLV